MAINELLYVFVCVYVCVCMRENICVSGVYDAVRKMLMMKNKKKGVPSLMPSLYN